MNSFLIYFYINNKPNYIKGIISLKIIINWSVVLPIINTFKYNDANKHKGIIITIMHIHKVIVIINNFDYSFYNLSNDFK